MIVHRLYLKITYVILILFYHAYRKVKCKNTEFVSFSLLIQRLFDKNPYLCSS